MKSACNILLVAILIFMFGELLRSDVPHFFSYQGRLTDSLGNPLNDTVELDFRIYADEYGNTMLWKEVHPSVHVIDGLFDVFLGSGKALPDSIFDGSVLWLGIMVDDGPTLEPLTPFIASPYSFRSIHADTADYAISAPGGVDGWTQSGNYVHLADNDDSVGIGVLTPVEKFHVGGNLQIGSYGDIKFSPENTRINCESNNLMVKAQSDLYLEPYDDLYIRRRDGGSSWAHFDNSTQRLGIGVLNPPYKLTVNGDISIANGGESKYHINYYQGGLNIAETGVQDRRIHISDGGNVGIGTNSAEEKLHVYGNAKIKDTIKVGAFEEDAISSVNVSNEVGLASNEGWNLLLLNDSWQTVVSRSIDVPAEGYVLAIASFEYSFLHGYTGESGFLCGISSIPDSLEDHEIFEFQLDKNLDMGLYRGGATCHSVFHVPSQGTYNYHFLARQDEPDNESTIDRRVLSVLYIPSDYGDAPSKGSSDITEIHDNSNAMTQKYIDWKMAQAKRDDEISSSHLETEIYFLKQELKDLKQRLDLLER